MKHNQHTGNEVLTIYRNADHNIKRTKGQKEKGKQQFKIKISRDFVLLYMENVPYPPFRRDVMLWIVPGISSIWPTAKFLNVKKERTAIPR